MSVSAESSSEGLQQQPASPPAASIWVDSWKNTENVLAASEDQNQHFLLLSGFPSAITDFFFCLTQRQVTLDGKICTFKVKYVVVARPAERERKGAHAR